MTRKNVLPMAVTTCDRCGAEFDRNCSDHLKLDVTRMQGTREWESPILVRKLCGGCMLSLIAWSREPGEMAKACQESNTLHQQAMDALERAELLGHDESAHTVLTIDAAGNEARAARVLRAYRDLQPTRAVLYRSAATLTLQTGDADEALELAVEGLVGAPAEIADELWDVIAQALPRAHKPYESEGG